MAKARPSDCTPPRWRSSASSSISDTFDDTSRAIAALRVLGGLTAAFGLARGFTSLALLLHGRPTVSGGRARESAPAASRAQHTTIAIDVQYYGKYLPPRS